VSRGKAWSFLFLVSFASACSSGKNYFSVKEKHVQVGSEFALSSDGVETARIAKEILKKGGNWADVFIASSFALAVERPQSTGIGGGGFALIYVAQEKKSYALDFREAAPLFLSTKTAELLNEEGKRIGALTSKSTKGAGVPGFVAGMQRVHKQWATLPWATLIAPSIKLAEKGFVVDALLEEALSSNEDKIKSDAGLDKVYRPQAKLLRKGDLLIQEDLAKTLKMIAAKGARDFYRGPIAKKIVSYVTQEKGYLRLGDFQKYRVIERQPMKWKEKNYEFHAFPYPSFGGEATQLMQSDDKLREASNVVSLVNEWVNTQERVYEFRAKRYEQSSDKPQTTHLSLMDAAGNVVSSTQTVNSAFGAGKMVPGTGILLNDEMDDFYYENPKALNHPKRSSRPLSSMAPTIVLESGRPKIATGSQGGRRLMSCVNWVLLNYLWHAKTLEEAVSSPRIHVAYPHKKLIVDKGTPKSWLKNLSAYEVENPPVDCRVQSVERSSSGMLKSVVDPRSTGVPLAL
jgi:gamma-glutamyltranspeptidase/glutathione hydrolase